MGIYSETLTHFECDYPGCKEQLVVWVKRQFAHLDARKKGWSAAGVTCRCPAHAYRRKAKS